MATLSRAYEGARVPHVTRTLATRRYYWSHSKGTCEQCPENAVRVWSFRSSDHDFNLAPWRPFPSFPLPSSRPPSSLSLYLLPLSSPPLLSPPACPSAHTPSTRARLRLQWCRGGDVQPIPLAGFWADYEKGYDSDVFPCWRSDACNPSRDAKLLDECWRSANYSSCGDVLAACSKPHHVDHWHGVPNPASALTLSYPTPASAHAPPPPPTRAQTLREDPNH